MTKDEDEKPVYESPTEEAEAEQGAGLKPTLTLFNGVMIIVGCIIGSGIFVSPKGVQEHAGSVGLSLIIWVICGLFSAIGAYCYAELGTFIKESGGDYAYVFAAFGPLMGFLRMWIECIIVRPCTITAVAMTFSVYILKPLFPDCEPPFPTLQLLAALCILLLAMVNCLSVKLVRSVQDIFTMAKLFALALIIFTGFVLLLFIRGKYWDAFENVMEGSRYNVGSLALAFYSGLWAYNGWNYLNFVTEELIDPTRNLPRAIAISCSLCTIIYTLTNIAFYAGTSADEMLDSPAVAVLFANRFYGPVAIMMPILVALSCFGTVNGVMFTSSRLFYVAGRREHMPVLLSYINPYLSTPIPAVLFTAFLSLFYLLLSDNIYVLISYVQIVNWLAIGVATAGLLWLRVKKPPSDFPRPLQVWIGWPIIFLIGCIFLVVFPVYQTPMDTAIGICIMLTGLPVYYLFVACRGKFELIDEFMDSLTQSCQKVFLVVPVKQD